MIECNANAVNWELNNNTGKAPQLKGARWFSLEQLKKYTSNFAEANTVGSGGYGKVRINNILYLSFLFYIPQGTILLISSFCLFFFKKNF